MKSTTRDDTLTVGQLRMILHSAKLVLVYEINGVYAGVLHSGGQTEGYYNKWLEDNSRVIHGVNR
jgi:hypothetical protein